MGQVLVLQLVSSCGTLENSYTVRGLCSTEDQKEGAKMGAQSCQHLGIHINGCCPTVDQLIETLSSGWWRCCGADPKLRTSHRPLHSSFQHECLRPHSVSFRRALWPSSISDPFSAFGSILSPAHHFLCMDVFECLVSVCEHM